MSISLMLLRLVLIGGICLLVGWLIEQRKKLVWRRIEREIKERRALALAGLPRPLRHERSGEDERGRVEEDASLDEDEVAVDQIEQQPRAPEGPWWFIGIRPETEGTSYAHFCARQEQWGHRASSWLGDLITSGSGAVDHPGVSCAEGDLGTSGHHGWSDGSAGSASHGDAGWSGGCAGSDGGGACD